MDVMETSEARRASGAEAERSAVVLHPASHLGNQQPHVPAAASNVKRFVRQQVPDDILHNTALNAAIAALPANYNFEIHKTVWRLKQANVKTVALQFPEGLLLYACTIADILEQFAGVEHTLVMGDVAYGACCVDDFSAAVMGADFLVHYGHSCLVPVDVTSIPCMYVFVDILIDIDHFLATVRLNFPAGTNLVIAGTIQFSSAVQLARQRLADDYPSLAVPKCKPLSPGEVLGCTAPVITQQADAIVFLADGRFHLEAIMIANPSIPAYRYDPYGRIFTRERYDHAGMRAVRRRAVEAAMQGSRWALILGTLGRQGNPAILDSLKALMDSRGMRYVVLMMSEISPTKLDMLPDRDVFVQVACPRLSIDWGEGFSRPTLTPYEAMVALGAVTPWWLQPQQQAPQQQVAQPPRQAPGSSPAGSGDAALTTTEMSAQAAAGDPNATTVRDPALDPYPMDYYAKEGGVWNSSYHKR